MDREEKDTDIDTFHGSSSSSSSLSEPVRLITADKACLLPPYYSLLLVTSASCITSSLLSLCLCLGLPLILVSFISSTYIIFICCLPFFLHDPTCVICSVSRCLEIHCSLNMLLSSVSRGLTWVE